MANFVGCRIKVRMSPLRHEVDEHVPLGGFDDGRVALDGARVGGG